MIYKCKIKVLRRLVDAYPDYVFWQEKKDYCIVKLIGKEQEILRQFNLKPL
jgi:hypothetical protein